MRIRTAYSFKYAIGNLEAVAGKIAECRYPSMPICDRASTFGFIPWSDLCSERGVRPVFGVELAVVEALGEKKPSYDYWSFFAKDRLADLHALVALATGNPGKEPSLTYAQALAAPGLVKIAGELAPFEDLRPAVDLYVALSPSMQRHRYEAAKKRKLKFILTPDNVYPARVDADLYEVALGRRASRQTYAQHITSDEEIACELPFVPLAEITAAVARRKEAFAKCLAKIERAEMIRPPRPLMLKTMCERGAKKLGVDLKNPVYKARLRRELEMIKSKNFEDYFYVIADLVNWARARMIVGPARGSSCGSLTCYLLGITSIDPIPFDLLFERFIDINRDDLPDIDIDFSDARREMVFEYVREKYGADRVARLGSVGTFQPRSALRAVASTLDVPPWKYEPVSEAIFKRTTGDSRSLLKLEDTLKETPQGKALIAEYPAMQHAALLEGMPSNASQHAAGIVITEQPITDYVAIDERTHSLMCDKYDAEAINLLKIDALGLTQLSIFERCFELAGIKDGNEYLRRLPLDDAAAFDVLNRKQWGGIFQYSGVALQHLGKQYKTEHIEDIISLTALARPGPIATGGANEWIQRRRGARPVTYPHPLFEPYLKGTLGIVIYQEQVMQIGREIGDLSWQDVTALRKAMSKSLGKEYFNQFGDKWKFAAAKKGIPADVLDKVWDDLCAYGSWAFNRSHSVAYGLISYWCCCLKSRFPLEYAAAVLDAEPDPARQIALLRELANEGVAYVPVDPLVSEDRWTVSGEAGKKTLVGPLSAIKGIGPAAVREIISSRRENKPLRGVLRKKLENPQTDIDSLFPIRDAARRLAPDLEALGIVSPRTDVAKITMGLERVMIIGVPVKIAPRSVNDPQMVAKRHGRKFTGPETQLHMFFRDDTDEIFVKIDRWKFEEIGRAVLLRGGLGRAIYAVRGKVPPDFRMIDCDRIKFLGFTDDNSN